MSTQTGIVNLHGREYRTVALRVEMFRSEHPDWTIETIGISFDNPIVFRCEIRNHESRLLATGHSEERRAQSGINSTSALENCETGAIGRALAALGYGGSEFASADELVTKLGNQAENGNQENQFTSEPKTASLADENAVPPFEQETSERIVTNKGVVIENLRCPTCGNPLEDNRLTRRGNYPHLKCVVNPKHAFWID